MASIDDLITELQVAINRPTILDGAGNDVSATWFPEKINYALRKLQRRLVAPWQTYTWQLVTIAGSQCYAIQDTPPYPSGIGDYRSTKGITLPYQTAAVKWGSGLRLNYLPHELARTKYQFRPGASALPPPPGTGFPCDYSIWWSNTISVQVPYQWNQLPSPWNTSTLHWNTLQPSQTSGVAYWLWPVPDVAYTLNVDQYRFLPDLVAGSGTDNWLTRELPDLVLAEAALQACRVLGDDTKAQRFLQDRNEAYDAAQVASAMFYDEQPYSAGMIEVG
jgi:hypothetical protein